MTRAIASLIRQCISPTRRIAVRRRRRTVLTRTFERERPARSASDSAPAGKPGALAC